MESAGQQVLRGTDEAAGAGRFGVPEVYALIALLSFLVARFVPVLAFHLECPFRALTGLPCATCGMTHAFVYLAHGRLLQALSSSPLGALLALCAWSYGLADLIRIAAGWPLPSLSQRRLRGLVLSGLAALLANWAFLVIQRIWG